MTGPTLLGFALRHAVAVAVAALMVACSPMGEDAVTSTATPRAVWLPDLDEDLPAALTDREPVAFCGLARGAPNPAAERCILAAAADGDAAEMALEVQTERGPVISIIRTSSTGRAEVIIGAPGGPGVALFWERLDCRTLRRGDSGTGVMPVDCEPPERLE